MEIVGSSVEVKDLDDWNEAVRVVLTCGISCSSGGNIYFQVEYHPEKLRR